MASSSTAYVEKSFKYDVFLSFRGEDTRKNFVDHLYFALEHKGIHTYKDDERIKKGKRISDELIKSIEDSRFYVIVFSKTYASSSWCLDELVKIMECQKTTQTAYPVFYDVEPTEVRKQSGEFGQAFAKHERKEAAEKWREALEEAAALAGWELKNTTNGHEAKFIQKIVEEISLELRSINCSVDGNLIGMQTRIKGIVSSLKMGSDDVRMIGIKGMGGSGKTTLARAVFDQISFGFEGKSFVENIREVSSEASLSLLQKQVLSDVLNDQGINVSSVYDGKKMMKKMMCGRKVLIVLDDVDHIDQLEALVGEPNWFKPGSRIIITTRDEQVLVAHRVNLICDSILLLPEEAICLFSRYAFGREVPIQGYEELSAQVVRYAAGLPLTIKVLGSFLCGKNEILWKDTLERLKTIPLKETLEKLELSYNGLEKDYQEIFLDVVCILKGWRKEEAIRVLESCGFHARIGLRVLEQKSLITISTTSQYDEYEYEYLSMHDHIEEMGKNIVRRLHPEEPNRHSRLWIDKEIRDILANDMDADTRCLKIMTRGFEPKIVMQGLGKMKKLRFLHVFISQSLSVPFGVNWIFDDVSQYFPNALRYLSWKCYPFWCLPKTFQANNLVELEMPFSRMMQLWEHKDKKILDKLRFLDLSSSRLMTLDLRLTPNLEVLNLGRCKSLVELHMPFECPKLKSIDLNFSELKHFDLRLTPNLEMLNLERCKYLVELHMPLGCPKLKSLCLNHSKLRTLNLGQTPNLETLSLENCCDLVELNMPVRCLKLTSLRLSCPKLRTLNLEPTLNLETLLLGGCKALIELHMPVRCLKLRSFCLSYSKVKTVDLEPCPNLEELDIVECNDLVELHMPVACPKIISINVSCSKLSTFDLRLTPNLETFSLRGCDNLVEFHMPIGCLKLKYLNLGYSKLTTLDLGLTPNLEELTCHDLVELHMPHECLELKSLKLSASKMRTLDLGMLPNLNTLTLKRCHDLVELHMRVGCLNLRDLKLSCSKLRTLDLGLTPNLKSLSVKGCHDLVELHMPPAGCPKLKFLNLSGSKLRTLDFGLTPNLERLDFKGCDELVDLHMLVGCLRLRSLNLSHSKLRTFDLGLTPNLYWLDLEECVNLVELRAPVGCLRKLVSLDLSGCSNFTSLFLEKEFESVEEVDSWVDLPLIMESLDICPLPSDDNLPKFRFTCFYKDPFFSTIGNLEKLLSIGLCARTNLRTFCQNLSGFRRLSNPDQLQCLEELILSSTEIKHFPGCIFMLKHLKSLELKSCWLLEKLPEDLGRLECLEKLTLSDCMSLREIPNGISKMRRLEYLGLPHCIAVEVLPQDLGYLECLKELNIEGTCIRHLPSSIFSLKGLRIVGCRWLLESCGFTSKIQTAEYETFCYI